MPLYVNEKGMIKAIKEAKWIYVHITEEIDPLYQVRLSKEQALQLIDKVKDVSVALHFQKDPHGNRIAVAYIEPG